MKYILLCAFSVMMIMLSSCDFTSPGVFTEKSRIYSEDSTKFILKYEFAQGAWDGGRTYLVTILNSKDSIDESTIKYLYRSFDFDDIYWKTNDTVIIEEKFTKYLKDGQSKLKESQLNDVYIKPIIIDPIDTSFRRKIFYQETSPEGKYKLIVYKYIKPELGNYFLNISIINKEDTIPKFGNFYVTQMDYDFICDIRWQKEKDILDIKIPDVYKQIFKSYLIKNRPNIEYRLIIDEKENGNIQRYMQ